MMFMATLFNETIKNKTIPEMPSVMWAKYDIASLLVTDMGCIQTKLTAFEAAISTIGRFVIDRLQKSYM